MLARGLISFTLLLLLSFHAVAEEAMTQDELLRRTKELFDGIIAEDNSAWQKYYAEDCLFFDERGRSMDKPALVKEIGPLPEGYELSFNIEKPQSRIFPEFAILSYDIDEKLTIFGQLMGARFHATDTWMRRNGKWEIIATQVFRYYGDPAPGSVDTSKFTDYVGTYELAPGQRVNITLESGQLYHQRADRPKELLIPEAPQIFFRKGVEGRMLFRYGKDGKVDAMISRRNHEDIVWSKTQQ